MDKCDLTQRLDEAHARLDREARAFNVLLFAAVVAGVTFGNGWVGALILVAGVVWWVKHVNRVYRQAQGERDDGRC